MASALNIDEEAADDKRKFSKEMAAVSKIESSSLTFGHSSGALPISEP